MTETETETGRLDGFAYRTLVADAMSAPLVTIADDEILSGATRRMTAEGVSSLAVSGAGGLGIVTERDVVVALARHGMAALDLPIGQLATRPVHTVDADAFVYVALGRMARLGVRHLIVVDEAGAPAGMITARALLKRRASGALALGDDIAAATDAAALGRVKLGLPALAGRLVGEGFEAGAIARIVSAVYRDMTARACVLAAESLSREGRGAAPARWCCLVLGSGGRGESLLAADQDNALIHEGREGDPWFAALGERFAAILDQAGLPLCKGGVMAARPEWRHTPDGWRMEIERWVARAEGRSLLAIDIFHDFAPVAGDRRLAVDLRASAMRAGRSPMLLRMLAEELADIAAPLGLFGSFRTEAGRLDLKRAILYPIVGAARVLALRHGIEATATVARLRGVAAAGGLPDPDLANATEAYEAGLRLVLEQQIADIAADRPPGTLVEIGRLSASGRARLRGHLRHAADFASGLAGTLRR